MSQYPGHFIVFEGGEGSGKTKQASLLADRLRAESGLTVHETHEPGGSSIGGTIRSLLLDIHHPIDAHTELFLFLAERSQHVREVIVPALERGETVICDRFTGSTLAYQIGGRHLDQAAHITQMEAFARGGLEPDVVLFLDLSPAKALARKKEGDAVFNRMDNEALEFHQRVYDYFIELSSAPTWVRIDTEGPKEENATRIYQEVMKRLNV